MTHRITTVLFLILISLSAWGQVNEEVFFTDSLTAVHLVFPANTKLQNISTTAFKKGVAVMDKTDIFIYSMKNSAGGQYAWERINEFDKNSKYGSLIRSEKINNTAEGWHRYYKDKTKKGIDYITCVTLVRGSNYALYMVESAFQEEHLKSKTITTASVFPIIEKKETKRTTNLSGLNWIIITIIFFSVFVLWPIKSLFNNKIKILLICLSVCGMLLYLLVGVRFVIFWSIIFAGFDALFWFACLYSSSWDEFWHWVEVFFNNLKV